MTTKMKLPTMVSKHCETHLKSLWVHCYKMPARCWHLHETLFVSLYLVEGWDFDPLQVLLRLL